MNKFLDDIDNKLKKESIQISIDPFFAEDKYLTRYNRKALVVKFNESQTGGSYESVTQNIDFDDFIKKIEKFDALIYAKLRTLEFDKTNQDLNKKIRDFVYDRFNINIEKYESFVLGDKIFLQSVDASKIHLNTIPSIGKVDKIYIGIQMTYLEYINNIKNVGEYIKKILESLTTKGDCVIYIPLTFNCETFYILFRELCQMFEDVTLYYPTYFRKTNSLGYIILKNKLDHEKFLSDIFDKKITKFYKRYIEHIMYEYELIDKLLAIKYVDEFTYKIMYNKLISQALLQYYK